VFVVTEVRGQTRVYLDSFKLLEPALLHGVPPMVARPADFERREQTVAAQWLMLSLTTSAVLLGAIQPTNLPVLLLSIPGGVFFVNSVSFVAVRAAVALTTVPVRTSMLPREHAGSATRAGRRFVRNSPALIAIMIRAAAFSFFAAGVWALLPLVARHTLDTALIVLAAGLAVSTAVTRPLALPRPGEINVTPAEAMRRRLSVDVETYLVGSWEEHERQHARATEHDQQPLAHIDTLLAPGTRREARHYLAALR
jgi:Transmembrane secretion effector